MSYVERTFRYWSLLLPKPLHRGDKRPWLERPELIEQAWREYERKRGVRNGIRAVDQAAEAPLAPPRDELPHILVGSMFDITTGKQVEVQCTMDPATGRLSPYIAKILGLAAVISGVAVLDVTSDGKLDHVIRWCHLLMELHGFSVN